MSWIRSLGSFAAGAIGAAAATVQIYSSMDDRPIKSLEDIAQALGEIATKVDSSSVEVTEQGLAGLDKALNTINSKVSSAVIAQDLEFPSTGLAIIRGGLVNIAINETFMVANSVGVEAPFIVTAVENDIAAITFDNYTNGVRKGTFQEQPVGDESCKMLFVRSSEDGQSAVFKLTCGK